LTLAEQLLEANEIKALVLQAMKDSAANGAMLAYTTSGTKVVYEGATKTHTLLKELNNEITTIKATQSQLGLIL